METLTRPPQTPVRPRSIAEAPRRWPKVLLLVTIVVIVSAMLATVLWVSNVEPFQRGRIGYAITDHSLHVVHRNIDALGASGTVQTVQMKRDMTFRYRFSVRNGSAVPITVLDVGQAGSDDDIAVRVTRANPDISRGAFGGFGPFAPFSLRPGAEAGIEVQVHVGRRACYLAGSVASIWELPITYRILGLTRHSWIDTGTELRLEGTRATSC